MSETEKFCAGCGAPAGLPAAGPCPGHPLSDEQRGLITHAYQSGLKHGEESAESRSRGTIDDAIKRVAKALLPLHYPDWPGRWGWVEATGEMKEDLLVKARQLVTPE